MATNPPLIMSRDGSSDAWTQNNFAQRPAGGRKRFPAVSDPAQALASATVRSATLPSSAVHADIVGPADCTPAKLLKARADKIQQAVS